MDIHSYSPNELAGYGAFPLLIAGVLLLLRYGLYKEIGGVMSTFRRFNRPKSLKLFMKSLILFLLGVFVMVQFIRLPLLENVFIALNLGSGEGNPPGHIVKAGLFTAMLLVEFVVLGHLLTYILLCWIGINRFSNPTIKTLPDNPPTVAVLVPACDEEPEILERTMSSVSRLNYPVVRPILVENSRREKYKKSAHSVASKYGVEVMDIKNRGTKAGALNDAEAMLDDSIKYIAVFDADQSVKPDMLSHLIPFLENDLGLAFVQTPQLNEDCESSLARCAMSQQQMLLYDCVLEGLAALLRPPCYGTNFVMRRKAIRESGGWDERKKISQTEDLATSYNIHSQGWKSLYIRHAYAVGLAPPSLQAYLKQQLRWALGNTALWLSILRQLISPKFVSPSWKVVATYLWSSGFYMNTLAISALAVWPTIVLIYEVLLQTGTKTHVISAAASGSFAFEWAYLSLYPLYVVVMFFPYINMRLRGYPLRNMMLVQALMAVSAPIYLQGIRQAVFNKKPVTFTTTREAYQSEQKSRIHTVIAPQMISFAVFFLTGTLIMQRCLEGPVNPIAWIIVFWIFIHTVSLGHFFLFNSSKAWEPHSSG